MSELAVIGAGSWGTALAIVLSPRFDQVGLWTHETGLAERMGRSGENDTYLPGFQIPANVIASTDLGTVLKGARIVLGVMPSRFARHVYSAMRPHLNGGMQFVSATKGIESGTLLRMSEVMRDVMAFSPRIAVLSGPTFAREVASGAPTAVVISSSDANLAFDLQRSLATPSFRLYRNHDPIGVELGAALKNIIAIAAGICHGLGLGNNSVAALITRGLAEITRLAIALGGDPQTLAGLAGLGDLVLTCTGELSRNRGIGIEMAHGRRIADITGSMKMIAEGVETTSAAVQLAAKAGVEMPITQQMNAILEGDRSPREALRELMERSLKQE